MANRPANFDRHVLIDTAPMPSDVPPVKEIGATSAPLLSASYFIGARCKAYNDDYMQCKTEAYGKGEFECMKEGRKVTRCAASVIDDINKNCLEEFRLHWNCLESWNHQLWQCRRAERRLNKCVFDKLSLEKHIPDTPPGETPVHLRKHQIFATYPQHEKGEGEWYQDLPNPVRAMNVWMIQVAQRRHDKYLKQQEEKQAAQSQPEEAKA